MNITAEMQRAIDRARHNGGKLRRLLGGHWIGANESHTSDSFSTRTAEALVTRGIAIYSDMKTGRNGPFPVELTLCEVAAKLGAKAVIGTRDRRAPMFSKGARELIANFRGVPDETPERSRERETKRIGDILPGLDV